MSRKPGYKEAKLQPAHGSPALVSLDATTVPMIGTILRTLKIDKPRIYSVGRAQKTLADILGRDEAVWLLAKINARDLHMEELQGNISIRVEARVSHVTSIPPSNHCLIVFKLTPETIKSLVKCCEALLHQDGKCQLEVKLNAFCYEADFDAIGRLQKNGCGELGCDESEKVKDNLMRILPHFESRVSLFRGPVADTTALSWLPPAFSTTADLYQPHFKAPEPLPIGENSITAGIAWWPSSIIAAKKGAGLLVPINRLGSSSIRAPGTDTLSKAPLFDVTGIARSFQVLGSAQSPQFLDISADAGHGEWSSGAPPSCYYES